MNDKLVPLEEFITNDIDSYVSLNRNYQRGYELIMAYIELLNRDLTMDMIIGENAVIDTKEYENDFDINYSIFGHTIAEKYRINMFGILGPERNDIKYKNLKEVLNETKEIPLKKGISLLKLLDAE